MQDWRQRFNPRNVLGLIIIIPSLLYGVGYDFF
jgi:hypothetical protein